MRTNTHSCQWMRPTTASFPEVHEIVPTSNFGFQRAKTWWHLHCLLLLLLLHCCQWAVWSSSKCGRRIHLKVKKQTIRVKFAETLRFVLQRASRLLSAFQSGEAACWLMFRCMNISSCGGDKTLIVLLFFTSLWSSFAPSVSSSWKVFHSRLLFASTVSGFKTLLKNQYY